jgi:hypothetical protein
MTKGRCGCKNFDPLRNQQDVSAAGIKVNLGPMIRILGLLIAFSALPLAKT